jgi:hypothetical protein
MTPAQKVQYRELRRRGVARTAITIREGLRKQLIATGMIQPKAAQLSWEMMLKQLIADGVVGSTTHQATSPTRVVCDVAQSSCAGGIDPAEGADHAVNDATSTPN